MGGELRELFQSRFLPFGVQARDCLGFAFQKTERQLGQCCVLRHRYCVLLNPEPLGSELITPMTPQVVGSFTGSVIRDPRYHDRHIG